MTKTKQKVIVYVSFSSKGVSSRKGMLRLDPSRSSLPSRVIARAVIVHFQQESKEDETASGFKKKLRSRGEGRGQTK